MEVSALAGGGGLLCVLLAGLTVAFVLFVLVVWMVRRRGAAASAVEAIAVTPDGPLDGIASRSERRDALLKRIEPALGCLGAELEVVKGRKCDLRLRGHLWGKPAIVVIDADGRFSAIEVAASFPEGSIVLRSDGQHDNPDDQLGRLDEGELELLIEQMGEARLLALRIGPAGLKGESAAALHEVGGYEASTIVGQTLAALESAIGLWQDREEPEEPEQSDDLDEPDASTETVPAPPESAPAASGAAPPASEAAPGVDPIKAALSWDYDATGRDPHAELSAGAALLFPALEDLLEKGKLVLPKQGDGTEAEIRGRVDGVPIRLILDGEGAWKIEGKITDLEDSLYVSYDPELPRVAGDPDDDWADQDEQRVFLAKGLYVESTPDVIEIYMRFSERMSEAQIDRLRDGMASLPVQFVWLLGDELEMGGSMTVQQMDDPVATLRAILSFAGWIGSDIPGSLAEAGSFSQVQCTYCSTRYFFGVRRGSCPNCSAPHGA